MKYIAAMVGNLVFIFTWIAGMVLASGFWSTTFAIFLPPWGWYLLIERLMSVSGMVG